MSNSGNYDFVVRFIDKHTKEFNDFIGNTKKAKKATDDFGKSGEKTKTSIKSLAKGFAGLFVLNEIKGHAVEASKAFNQLDESMRMVNTINRKSEEDFKAFNSEVRDLAKILPQTQKEIGDSLFYVASAGVEASQQLDILTIASAGALASGSDMKTVFDGMSATVKGFNLEFSDSVDVMDKFFKINELGQTTVGDVSKAIQRVASLAKTANVTFNETSAIFATFTGVTGNAAEVSTQLRGAINALASPTVEAKKRFEALGVEVGQAAIQEKGFAVVAKEVFDSVNGNTEALRQLVPEVEANLLITALSTSQYDVYNDKLNEVSNSSGALKKATMEMAKSHKFQYDVMKSSVDDFKVSFGQAINTVIFHAVTFGKGVFKMGKLIVKTFGTVVSGAWNFVKSIGNAMGRVAIFLKEAFDVGPKEAAKNFKKGLVDDFQKNAFSVENSIGDMKNAFAEMNEFAINPASEAQKNYAKQLESSIDNLNKQKEATKSVNDEIKKGANNFDFSLINSSRSQGSVKDDTDKVRSALQKLAGEYGITQDKAKNELEQLEQDHQINTSKIKAKIDELNASLEDLKKNYEKSIGGLDQSLGNKVIDQQANIKDLKDAIEELNEEMADLGKDKNKADDAEDRADIQERIDDAQKELDTKKELLKKEEQALKEFMERSSDLDDEIAEAKRRAGLTEFERFVEDVENKKSVEEAQYLAKKAQIEAELKDTEDALEKENQVYNEKKALYDETLEVFENMVSGMSTGYDNINTKTQKTVDEMKAKLAELKRVLSEIKSLTAPKEGADNRTLADIGHSFGAIDPTGNGVFESFRATGGMVTANKPYVVGERGEELFVPRTAGTIVPSEKLGNASSPISLTINIQGNSIDSQSRIDDILEQAEQRFVRQLELANKGIN